jgi:hypothetical protein
MVGGQPRQPASGATTDNPQTQKPTKLCASFSQKQMFLWVLEKGRGKCWLFDEQTVPREWYWCEWVCPVPGGKWPVPLYGSALLHGHAVKSHTKWKPAQQQSRAWAQGPKGLTGQAAQCTYY